MTYKNFYFSILFRIGILIALTGSGAYLIMKDYSLYVLIIPAILLVITIINIIQYFNNINQWITFFLLGIENEDTSIKAPSKTGNKAINDVYMGIERLNELFKQSKIEINTQEQYFKSVINKSATGLFSINEKGRVVNINPEATKLTGLQDYHHVNSLSAIDSALPTFILNSKNELKQKSAIFENKYGQKLHFNLSEIKSSKEIIRLVAVSDITKELDNREIEAWIKLARTLSHEIMNNIAPITTLSQVISEYFIKDNKPIDLAELNIKTISNTVKGLKVIEERSLGLMSFVNNYRKFTKLPQPEMKETNISDLLENNILAAETFKKFNTIQLIKHITENIKSITDEKLLSQVIINLLKNACEALTNEPSENPKLRIKLSKTEAKIKIEISNNGPVIPPEIKEQIFIPFFTTKEDGTGVGLSLSKQIMLKMDGDILLESSKDLGTVFSVIINS